MRQALLLSVSLLLFAISSTRLSAQVIASPELQAVASAEITLYAGPGETYRELGRLEPEQEVMVTERNRVGTWVRVRGSASDSAGEVDGWVLTGLLTLHPTLRLSQVPVNSELGDADLENIDDPELRRLYAVPVISRVSAQMQLVYQRGRLLGNDSRVVTKVGDSLTADPLYLTVLGREDNELGPFDFLVETMVFFGPQTGVESVAARVGMSTRVVFDPMWTRNALCEPNETPLACEYRLRRPSVALIMFGPNDVLHMDVDAFGSGLREIIEESIQLGVIPVLSTFSSHPESQVWEKTLAFNLTIVDVAEAYGVPLINLWSAARSLPNYGLEGDHVHMRHSGYRYLKFDIGNQARYGVSLRNFLSLRMLDEIRRTLGMS